MLFPLLVPGGTAAAAGSGSLTLLIVFVVLAIGVSFLCSIMEAVLLSVSPAYVGAMEETNPTVAARLKALKADVDRPLAAILTLNTIAHTVGATGAGAQAAAIWGSQSVWIFSAVAIFSTVLTLGILILSEIIPKTLGAVYWRGLAPLVARVLAWTVWVLKWTGLIWMSQMITKLIARGEKEGAVSREELAALAQIGADEGIFDDAEHRILQNLFRFRQLKASDVMTPRTVVVAYPETTPLHEIANDGTPFSRLPLYGASRDDISAYVLRDDVLAAVADGRADAPASSVARDLMAVPDSLSLPVLFERLLDRREHLALVVGEYGGTAGVVSVEDVVETLLGLEIVDESDDDHDMQAAARARWTERAERLGIVPIGGPAIAPPGADPTIAGITGGQPPTVD
ncbi:CNNM domain-containing protein [Rubrivirga sp. IMCC43871]|uniref:CNNM domain-containing protein n=1 Tax=Rubrivirga sp. IMCC43871 TaxID=3391575 RepID=UPI00398FD8DA